jgi:probable addiction module antidote protein
MTTQTKPWDAAEILNSDERVATYLEEAFDSGDATIIASALGDVTRARNISAMARETGLTRETLYKAFAPGGNPTLATLLSVAHALGFDVTIKPRQAPAA